MMPSKPLSGPVLRHFTRYAPIATVAIALFAAASICGAITISDRQAEVIGKKIWQNECAGTVSGLTTWNKGEEFPSLGIAHFIWYPKGVRGPFHESFPGLVRFLNHNGVKMPTWTNGPCPWPSRSAFQADLNGARLKELRRILAATVGLQARFAAIRLEKALPTMLKAAPAQQRQRIRENFDRVAAEPMGPYALMDYVNFKGEGTSPKERYKGEGWGLLQVLERMSTSGPAMPAYRKAANETLAQRIRNSPPGRNEAKWMKGWSNRISTYRN